MHHMHYAYFMDNINKPKKIDGYFLKLLIYLVYKMATASSCEAGPAIHVFDKKGFQKGCRDLKNAVQKGDMSVDGMRRLSAFAYAFLYERLKSTLNTNTMRQRTALFFKTAEEIIASQPAKRFSRNETAIASDRMNQEASGFLYEIKRDCPQLLNEWECVIYHAFQTLAVAFPEITKQTPEGDVIIVFEGFKNGLEKPKHYDDCGLKPFKKTN